MEVTKSVETGGSILTAQFGALVVLALIYILITVGASKAEHASADVLVEAVFALSAVLAWIGQAFVLIE